MATLINRPDRDLTHEELQALVREAARLRSEETSRLLDVGAHHIGSMFAALRRFLAGSRTGSRPAAGA